MSGIGDGDPSENSRPLQHSWRPKMPRLDLAGQLTADQFEKLVALLASDLYAGTKIEVHRFGSSGHAQGGIDVIAFGDSRGSHCFEAKRRKKITPQYLRDIIRDFLAARHIHNPRAFTLCTTLAMHERPSLIVEWETQRKLLESEGIEATLWDDAHLQAILRGKYAIVCEIAGDIVAKDFCTDPPGPPTPDAGSPLHARHMLVSGRWASFENVSVSGHLLLPGEGSLSTNATISFNRPDLVGVLIGVSSSELVSWAQWAVHAGDKEARPYASCVQGKDQYVFTARAARFMLSRQEVLELDWALAALWRPILEGAQCVLRGWRSEAFQQKDVEAADPRFEICSIHESLWRLLIAFAKEHDCAHGSSPWHIFDKNSVTIKVFNRRPTERMDAGFHVFLDVERSANWTPADGWLTVVWKPPQGYGNPSWTLSAREYWDATYAHDWLREELIPAALAWSQAIPDDTKRSRWRWLVRETQQSPMPIDIDGLCHSLAIPGVCWTVVPSDDPIAFHDCAAALQRHFHGRRSDVPVEVTIWRRLLIAVERFSPYCRESHERYIRGNLRLPDDSTIAASLRDLIAASDEDQYSFAVDLALRVLMALTEDLKSFPRSELGFAAAQLQPLLDRFHEDLVCDRFNGLI